MALGGYFVYFPPVFIRAAIQIILGGETHMREIPGAQVAGAAILQDLRMLPEVALDAFQVYRCVMMWAQERERTGEDPHDLFDHDAMVEMFTATAGGTAHLRDELRAYLVAIIGELLDSPPDPTRLARACLCVTEWALPRKHVTTGLAFAEAAAQALPTARYAFLAGKLHRQYGRHHQAERWLKEAEDLARKEKDWEIKVRVMLARGSVDLARGLFAPAEADFQRALRMCESHRLRGAVRGEVHHDLLTVAIGRKEHAEAQKHAEAALAAYGQDHPRLPHLAHDMAVLWMDTGDYPSALQVLLPLMDHTFTGDPGSRMMVCASTLRAAGGCADAAAYARTVPQLEKALEQAGAATVRHAPALLDAARAAFLIKDEPRAVHWVTRAREMAVRMEQEDIAAEAERLAALARVRPAPPGKRDNRPVAAKTVAALAGSAN
jgi:tetratricopeptide (TPR) repeat protein